MVTCDVSLHYQIEVKKATPREMTVRPTRGGGPPYGFRGMYIFSLINEYHYNNIPYMAMYEYVLVNASVVAFCTYKVI